MNRGPGTAEKPARESDSKEKSGVRTTTLLGTTRLRFERWQSSCVLTVEAPARDDLIHELYRLLFSSGVQVVRVHAQVLGDRVAPFDPELRFTRGLGRAIRPAAE